MGLAELRAKRLERLAGEPNRRSAAAMDRAVKARLLTPRLALNAAGILLMIAIATYWALHFGRNSVRVERGRLTLATVSEGVFNDYIPVTGAVQPETTVYLDVAQGGQVEERLVEEGATVQAGQPLVRFRNTALELQVTTEEAQLAESLFQLSSVGLQMQDSRLQHQRDLTAVEASITDSERRLARLRPLLADGFIKRADFEDEEATLGRYRTERTAIAEARALDLRAQADQTRQLHDALAQLEHNHTIAQHTLDDLTVRAPIDGQLTTLDAEIGSSKSPGRVAQNFPLTSTVQSLMVRRLVSKMETLGGVMSVKGIYGFVGAAMVAGAAVPAAAQFIPGVSVTPELSVSTLGIGPELDIRPAILPIGLRIGGNFFSLTRNISSNDIEYHGKADLKTGSFTADWYPFLGGLRLSAGIRLNGNKATVDALPNANGTITINHVAYPTAGSSVNGQITFRDVAPYAGLGYSTTLLGGLALGLDLGAMFQGTPRAALAAQGLITQAPGFATNLAQETQSLQNKVKDFSVYPVVEVTVGWRF